MVAPFESEAEVWSTCPAAEWWRFPRSSEWYWGSGPGFEMLLKWEFPVMSTWTLESMGVGPTMVFATRGCSGEEGTGHPEG